MSKSRTAAFRGKYLSWEHPGNPPIHCVYGHVTDGEFRAAVAEWCVEPNLRASRHAFGFWAQTGNSRNYDWRGELLIREEPGRGRFPITVAETS